jgi:hypothetical protein
VNHAQGSLRYSARGARSASRAPVPVQAAAPAPQAPALRAPAPRPPGPPALRSPGLGRRRGGPVTLEALTSLDFPASRDSWVRKFRKSLVSHSETFQGCPEAGQRLPVDAKRLYRRGDTSSSRRAVSSGRCNA